MDNLIKHLDKDNDGFVKITELQTAIDYDNPSSNPSLPAQHPAINLCIGASEFWFSLWVYH